MNVKYIKVILVAITFCVACTTNYTPKPKGYIRINFPEKKYQLFDAKCPFTFEYPVYGQIVMDTQPHAEPYWMNVEFSDFKAKIHLSYKLVNNNLNGFIEDSHTLAYKHAIKADGIEELLISEPQKHVYGLIYSIEGNAASSIQFYLTDSGRHFLRGSLYFETQINKDSLAPAILFFKQDVLHLINTLNWEK